MNDLEHFMSTQGGITSVPDLAHYLGVPRSELREACAERGVKRVGAAFVIDLTTARDLAEDFDDEDDLDDDEDDLDLDDDEEPGDEDE